MSKSNVVYMFYKSQLIFICTYLLVPFLQSISYLKYFLFVSMIMMLISIAILKKDYYKKMPLLKFSLILYLLLTIIIPIPFSNVTITNRYCELSLLFIYYFIYDFGKQYDNNFFNKKLVIYILIISFSTCITTFYHLLENPYYSRMIKSSGDITNILLKQNIGGYSIIYYLENLSLVLLFYIVNISNKDKIYKTLFYIVFSAIIIFTIFLSNYLTALLMLLVSIFIGLFSLIYNKVNIFSKMLIFCCGLLVIFNYKAILLFSINSMIDISGDSYNAVRLISLKEDLISKKNISANVYEGRSDLLKLDFEQIKKYPITGIVINKLKRTNGYYTEFGQHSYIFDTFALYGIPIGILLIFVLIFLFKYYYIELGSGKLFYIVLFVNFVFLLLINNGASTFGVPIFLIAPIMMGGLQK